MRAVGSKVTVLETTCELLSCAYPKTNVESRGASIASSLAVGSKLFHSTFSAVWVGGDAIPLQNGSRKCVEQGSNTEHHLISSHLISSHPPIPSITHASMHIIHASMNSSTGKPPHPPTHPHLHPGGDSVTHPFQKPFSNPSFNLPFTNLSFNPSLRPQKSFFTPSYKIQNPFASHSIIASTKSFCRPFKKTP